MKKTLLAIGSLLIAAIVIVSFVNAGSKTKDPAKQTTEMCKEKQKGSCCAASAAQACENKTAPCCKEKCQAGECKAGEGKCKEACKAEGKCEKAEGKCPKAEGKQCCKAGTGTDAK